MGRRYGQMITDVVLRAEGAGASPASPASTGLPCPARFRWQGRTVIVEEALGMWHLRDRWWETRAPDETAATQSDPQAQDTSQGHAASDRRYYRLACVGGLVCDVYYDAVRHCWLLDRVYD